MISEVEQLEKQADDFKSLIERRDQAIKLSSNYEFKKLILEYYMVEEAARYVGQSANPAMSKDDRADALALAQAAGHLKRWLSVQIQMGDMAERNLVDIQNAIEEARQEDAE